MYTKLFAKQFCGKLYIGFREVLILQYSKISPLAGYLMTAIWDNQDSTYGQGGESCPGDYGWIGPSVLGGLGTWKHPHPGPGRNTSPRSLCI